MATVIPAGPSILSEALGVARFLQSQEALRFNKQQALDKKHLLDRIETRLGRDQAVKERLYEAQIRGAKQNYVHNEFKQKRLVEKYQIEEEFGLLQSEARKEVASNKFETKEFEFQTKRVLHKLDELSANRWTGWFKHFATLPPAAQPVFLDVMRRRDKDPKYNDGKPPNMGELLNALGDKIFLNGNEVKRVGSFLDRLWRVIHTGSPKSRDAAMGSLMKDKGYSKEVQAAIAQYMGSTNYRGNNLTPEGRQFFEDLFKEQFVNYMKLLGLHTSKKQKVDPEVAPGVDPGVDPSRLPKGAPSEELQVRTDGVLSALPGPSARDLGESAWKERQSVTDPIVGPIQAATNLYLESLTKWAAGGGSRAREDSPEGSGLPQVPSSVVQALSFATGGASSVAKGVGALSREGGQLVEKGIAASAEIGGKLGQAWAKRAVAKENVDLASSDSTKSLDILIENIDVRQSKDTEAIFELWSDTLSEIQKHGRASSNKPVGYKFQGESLRGPYLSRKKRKLVNSAYGLFNESNTQELGDLVAGRGTYQFRIDLNTESAKKQHTSVKGRMPDYTRGTYLEAAKWPVVPLSYTNSDYTRRLKLQRKNRGYIYKTLLKFIMGTPQEDLVTHNPSSPINATIARLRKEGKLTNYEVEQLVRMQYNMNHFYGRQEKSPQREGRY